MFSLEELFCSVDDFCQVFEPQWQRQLLSHDLQVRNRKRSLCLSEIMTILIGFHQSCYRNFKTITQKKFKPNGSAIFQKLLVTTASLNGCLIL
jgi:hypothetical protein